MTFKKSLSIIMSAVIAAATSGVFNVAAPQSITAVAVDTAEASDNFNGLIFHEPEEIYDYPLYFEKAVNLQKNGTYSDRENGFFLCDINADGIPELFVTYDTEDESIYFAGSIYNEELQVIYNNTGIGAWGGGSSFILYTNGCFGTSSRDNSTFYNTIYKYDGKGKRTTISSVSVDLASNEYNKYIDDKSYSITESEYNSILNQYKIASYTTASVSDYLSAAENTKTFDSWQEGYKEELSKTDYPNSYTYGIMDINADGVPELMVQSSSAVMPSYLYTFYRNKVIKLMGLEKGGSVSYCKADNTCLAKGGSAGYVYYRTFKIQNGNAQKIDDVFWDTGNSYTLNDKSITQSQYQTWQSNNIASKTWKEFDCISFNEMNSKLAAMMPVTTTTTKPTTTTTTTPTITTTTTTTATITQTQTTINATPGPAAGETYTDTVDADSSPIKPILSLSRIELTVDEAKANPVQNIQLSIEGANEKYGSTGISIVWDDRLTLKDIDSVTSGEALQPFRSLTSYGSVFIRNGKSKNELYLGTAAAKNCGKDGVMLNIPLIVPSDCKAGDIYPIQIVYRSGGNDESLFTNIQVDQQGYQMEAWVFTKGIIQGYIEIKDDTPSQLSSSILGDANLDGRVTVADAVAILQFVANKDKYDLNSQARKNADCFNVGDGITGKDALAIQRLDAKVIAKLPYNE